MADEITTAVVQTSVPTEVLRQNLNRGRLLPVFFSLLTKQTCDTCGPIGFLGAGGDGKMKRYYRRE